MSVEACADIVARGDPARFRAVMAAPPSAREKLFPLYAFNVEIARAAYVTAEPGIAEIRLQWWIDALDEIATGNTVRRHEVVTPLAQGLGADHARTLQGVVEARFHEVYSEPFANTAALETYLATTSGTLLEVAAALLGQGDPHPARVAGYAMGLANWFIAVPALKSAGKQPLPDTSPDRVRALADKGLAALAGARSRGIIKPARPAFYAVAGARQVLKTVRSRPQLVLEGGLEPGPLVASMALMQAVMLNRW